MRSHTSGSLARPLLVGGVVVLLDQVTKRIAASSLARGESVEVIGDFFRLTHVQNPGGAFGLFRGAGSAFLVLSIVAVIFLFWTVRRYPARAWGMRIALGLVLGGALGNLIDRVRTQRVIDFLDFGFAEHRWPVFNVADVAVVVGVGLFLLFSMRSGGSLVELDESRGGEESPDGSSRSGPDPA